MFVRLVLEYVCYLLGQNMVGCCLLKYQFTEKNDFKKMTNKQINILFKK